MKALARNKQTFHYALPTGTLTDVYDSDGLYTGVQTPSYGEPIEVAMNISPGTGRAVLEWFGIATNYDKVLVTDDTSCPITEDTILWIGIEPTTTTVNNGVSTTVNNPHNYVVNRVGKSLNSIAYGVTEVSVGG